MSDFDASEHCDTCAICGAQAPENPGYIWVDRALTVCVCDDCYDSLSTNLSCPECGTMLFLQTDPNLGKVYPFVCINCGKNVEWLEAINMMRLEKGD